VTRSTARAAVPPGERSPWRGPCNLRSAPAATHRGAGERVDSLPARAVAQSSVGVSADTFRPRRPRQTWTIAPLIAVHRR
jgi:hypothetical protein